ncbi:hypothetical protein DXA15_22930 [Parabacteroides sp. AM58-2XD]|uniref:NVEALA domain-containing protein n=1 Tax=Parabacteroides TaxID=375288 RepID=UPI000FE245CE|nr:MULTISPECIES: NVEALA domain-containing protein [Parabacteroides]MCM0720248.1 NVEALA domain-containing protein [Parabacteroides sp. W1-Q-101]RGY91989.1 hypothetical protein DXA15_22930 [Parabacteroides sp. AM58-2XD]GKG74099.1 hypothetical protein CE91St1_32420 [Parabacteroides goldsteinii]GKG82494.1 hypothetical protein CE91St2_56860 [Parabacteroides goldsteinii]
MKNIIKTGLVLSSLLGAWYYCHTASQKSLINDLAFDNIEALAGNGEGSHENYVCFNYGEVDCYGDKVEVKYSGFSLD